MLFIVNRSLEIPLSEMGWSFSKSSGPGGQNVNKVNSKATLRWNLLGSPSVSEERRSFLLKKLASQLTQEGEIVLSSDRYRDQIRNRQDCLEKLRELLLRAITPSKPRKPTRPTKSSRTKRKDSKMKHAERKKMRSKIIPAFFLFFAIHAEAAEIQLQYFAEGQATPQEMTLNKIRRKMYCRTPERARHVIRLEWLKSTSAPAVLGNESGECKNFLNWGTQKICETPANQEQIAALIQACTK